MVQLCFMKTNGQRRYKYLVLGRDRPYFVKKTTKKHYQKFFETDIINMLVFLIDNIFFSLVNVFFNRRRHTYGYKLCSLLTDLFLYSYEADFIQGLLEKNERKLARSFHFTFSYIDDVLSLNNFRLGDFVDRIYPIALEIKDTTDTDRSD